MNPGRSVKPVVAITGAYGYIGRLLGRRFEAAGWSVRALVRSPKEGDRLARRYELGLPPADGLLDSVDVLVHCAYDLSLFRREDVWRVNVEGSSELLRTAVRAGVPRIIVLSSMSAYEGTTQLYGQVKLAIEAATMAVGGCPVRPGLVYGDDPGRDGWCAAQDHQAATCAGHRRDNASFPSTRTTWPRRSGPGNGGQPASGATGRSTAPARRLPIVTQGSGGGGQPPLCAGTVAAPVLATASRRAAGGQAAVPL